ncbi:hypothetical protein CIB48_g4437 [Xylaria polymorpha]|nr:hypothetical protein CIB48_g4437 [Xylaria polymorpha]
MDSFIETELDIGVDSADAAEINLQQVDPKVPDAIFTCLGLEIAQGNAPFEDALLQYNKIRQMLKEARNPENRQSSIRNMYAFLEAFAHSVYSFSDESFENMLNFTRENVRIDEVLVVTTTKPKQVSRGPIYPIAINEIVLNPEPVLAADASDSNPDVYKLG